VTTKFFNFNFNEQLEFLAATRHRSTIGQLLQKAAGWLLPIHGPVLKLMLLWFIIKAYKYKYKDTRTQNVVSGTQ